jgi:hypothetical protein
MVVCRNGSSIDSQEGLTGISWDDAMLISVRGMERSRRDSSC